MLTSKRIDSIHTAMKKIYLLVFSLSLVITAFSQEGEFHLDKNYKINKNGTIDLGASDARVFITGSNRADAHVKIDRKVTVRGWYTSKSEFTVDVDDDGGDLKIREHSQGIDGGIVSYYKEEYKIEVEAPEGVSLRIRGDDGDYYIKNINGAISMSIDDADAELVNCNGDNFSFRIDDGDIRMDKGKGSLDIEADDADIEIYNGAFSSIHANVDDGDLIIETSLANDGVYNIDAQDGTLSLNITGGGGEFDIRHDDANVLTQGNFKTNEESESRTRISLEKGNARVTVRVDDARVKLAAK